MKNPYLLNLDDYLIRHVQRWADERGMTLEQAVQVLLSRAMWGGRCNG